MSPVPMRTESELVTSFVCRRYCLWRRLRRTPSVYELLFLSNSDFVCWYVQMKEKPDFSNAMLKCASMEFVWNKEDFVPFHPSNLPFHTWAIPYSIPIFPFQSIPFHTVVCPAQRTSITFTRCIMVQSRELVLTRNSSIHLMLQTVYADILRDHGLHSPLPLAAVPKLLFSLFFRMRAS